MIGDQLKKLRKHFNLSQQDLADRLLLNKSSISLFENNKRDLSQRTLTSICEEFNVTEIWLRTGDGEMFQSESENLSLLNNIIQELNLSDISLLSSINKLIMLSEDELKAIDGVLDQFLKGR